VLRNARGIERPNGYQNRYKPGGFQTVAGVLDLSIPQAHNGGFRPTLFERVFPAGVRDCLA